MIGNAWYALRPARHRLGLITCFEAVAHVNPADKATILSAGISEAMNCTAFGLIVAIPSLIMFSLFNGKTQHMLDDINESSVGVLNLVIATRTSSACPRASPSRPRSSRSGRLAGMGQNRRPPGDVLKDRAHLDRRHAPGRVVEEDERWLAEWTSARRRAARSRSTPRSTWSPSST
jgi:hypothetical protein